MRRAWIFVAMALCGTSAAGAAVIDFAKLRRGYDEQIRFVAVCGSWQHGEDHGFFRLTEAYIYAQSFFYVQWMKDYDSSTTLTTAAATVSFEDVLSNDHAEIELSDIRCEERQGGVRVVADAYFGHEDRHRRMVLDLSSEPGKYQLSFLPSGELLQPAQR